jgi:hypothetical protein
MFNWFVCLEYWIFISIDAVRTSLKAPTFGTASYSPQNGNRLEAREMFVHCSHASKQAVITETRRWHGLII